MHCEKDNGWDLLSKLKQNHTGAAEEFYTKYASLMFGCILKICKQEDVASGIFKNVFLNLRNITASKVQSPFAFWLWQHTGLETKKLINAKSALVATKDREPMIEFLCFNKGGRTQATMFFKMDKEEIGLRVKKELQYTS